MKRNAKNEIIVLPTDTLYGICTSAFDEKAVEKIYDIKGRDENKPFIVLISKLKDLEDFGISSELIRTHKKLLNTLWPGKVSVILPIEKKSWKEFAYLHRGQKSFAFRMPKKKSLQRILTEIGPLVAPSANPQGLKPATNIREAKLYFGNKVDTYISGGKLIGSPSTIIEVTKDGNVKLVREGAVRVELSNHLSVSKNK